MLADMQSLDFYLQSAHKAICKWGNTAMLKDEDTIADVAYMMMRADEKFDGRGTVTGHRMSWAKFGILNAITKYNKKKSQNIQSLDVDVQVGDGRSTSLHERVADDKTGCAEDEYLKANLVETINETETLRDREKVALIRYFLYGDTYKEIGNLDGITPEAVRQNINSGLVKLRDRMTA